MLSGDVTVLRNPYFNTLGVVGVGPGRVVWVPWVGDLSLGRGDHLGEGLAFRGVEVGQMVVHQVPWVGDLSSLVVGVSFLGEVAYPCCAFLGVGAYQVASVEVDLQNCFGIALSGLERLGVEVGPDHKETLHLGVVACLEEGMVASPWVAWEEVASASVVDWSWVAVPGEPSCQHQTLGSGLC